MPEDKRAEFLEANCDAVEKLGYTRRFSKEELAQKKERFAELSISISDIEQEKADSMASFKERMKPLSEEKKDLLFEIKQKSEFVNENCYKFIDYEDKTVYFYNALGEMVYSRPIMPQEMQRTTFSVTRQTTGTNN